MSMQIRKLLAGLACLCAFAGPVNAAGNAQTASPYFEAFSEGKKVENLPLAMTKVDITVAGVIADVSLTQTYENRGNVPIEAIYVFPASARASVYSVTMTIGNRVVVANIQERQKARAVYEQAKTEGRSATLLEQQDVGAFRMNLANVLPGDKIKVELKYVELLVPTAGVYEFFFPNTAPQVKYQKSGDPDGSMPRSSSAEVTDFSLIVKAKIVSSSPIASLESPSHKLVVVRPSENEAELIIDADDAKSSTRDFVLRYSLRGNEIQTGAMAYRDGDTGYLLVMAQPPAVVKPASVPPREYIFIVDVSGSMNGQPIDVAKGLIEELFVTLKPSDKFNMVLFAGSTDILEPKGSLSADDKSLAMALNKLEHYQGAGFTELYSALEDAYEIPRTNGMARTVVIVTDGAITAGSDVSNFIQTHLNESNAFIFGVGSQLDETVIERIARAGEGEPFMVHEMSKGAAEASRMRQYIDKPVMTQISAKWNGTDAYDVVPEHIPDLFADRPIVLLAKYRGKKTGKLLLTGYSGSAASRIEVDLDKVVEDPKLKAISLLWARRKLDRLLDNCDTSCRNIDVENVDPVKKQITDIGLSYSLLTPFTSFVAVTEEVRTNEAASTVNQPAVARPAAAPTTSAGYGFTPAVLAEGLQISSMANVSDFNRQVVSSRLLAGRQMQLIGDIWRDLAHRDNAIILRIRRNSEAYQLLLMLRPELKELLELGSQVMVSFGKYTVLVSPNGFSDYPDGFLENAISGK